MSYGVKYKCEFKSSLNADIKVYILKEDYNSAVQDITMSGIPVRINYVGEEEKYNIIRGSECILEFQSEYNNQFSEIMLADLYTFQVQIWKNNSMIWQGFVVQDNYTEPFQSAPYFISIRATDGLGSLKTIDFKSADSSFYLNQMTFIEVIQKCLSKLKNATQLVTSIDVFESRIDRVDTKNEALNKISVNPYLFIEDDLNTLKCDVVLTYILQIFNCYIHYSNGKYFIERVNYKYNETIIRRNYPINFDGVLAPVASVTTENISGNIGRNTGLLLTDGDASITYQPLFNKIQIDSDVVNANAIIVNSYFRNWNASTGVPFNWVKSGTLNIAKLNNIQSGDYIQVNEKVADANLSYTSNMLTALNVNFNGYNSDAKLSIKFASAGNARFMVKAMSANKTFYLECYPNDESGEVQYTGAWKENPTYCKIERNFIATRPGQVGAWYVTNIDDMNLPTEIRSLQFSLLPSYDTSSFSGGYRVRQFTPTISTSESTDINGTRYTVASTKLNNDTYSDLSPSMGEFANTHYVNQLLINGEYTQEWYRDGKNEKLPLIEIAGRSILNQYRRNFQQFSGTVLGHFEFGKVYNIDGAEGKFMPYKANLDLKNDTTEVEFSELLPDVDDSTDVALKLINYADGEYLTRANPPSLTRRGRNN
jgi:hypothetical protein